jgi:hypothetical protein
MFGYNFRQMAGGQNDIADFLRGQITHDPFQKWPAIYRSHRLRDFRQQMLDAPAKAPGEDDGDDFIGRNAHRILTMDGHG